MLGLGLEPSLVDVNEKGAGRCGEGYEAFRLRGLRVGLVAGM
jgi:hypothetical protein